MSIQETLAAMKDAASKPVTDDVAKSFSQPGTQLAGHQYIDLEGPAKSVVIEDTPLLNATPRSVEGYNIQSNWKMIRNITGGGGFFGGVGERQRGVVVQSDLHDFYASFKTLGTENEISQEAVQASKGFDDLLARSNMEAVIMLKRKEENAILFGRGVGYGLGTTPTPVLTAGSGGSLGAGDVSVICVALTCAGKLASSVSVGVVAEVSSTNPNGETIVEAGGAAQKSAAALVTVSASGKVSAVVEPVVGAAGYAWFAGADGAEKLVAITGINSVVITALNGAGQAASALASADKSFSDRVYNGLLTLATPSIGAYSKVMASGAAGVGSSWTSDGVGGIEEINEALAWFYDEHKISPTDLFVSAKQFVKLRKAILSADNASIHFQAGSTSGVAGGGSMLPYMNPLGSATGVSTLRIRIHPTIGDSLALFYSDRVPGAVNLPVVSRMLLRHDYRQYSWPTQKRNYEFGVYVDGVLQHYAPFTMGVISNLA